MTGPRCAPGGRRYGGGAVAARELERIKQAGGWVNDGRVLGILAVSRAFGDLEFKVRPRL